MSEEKIPTGCHALDELLRGGVARGEITLIYGEAATGKTTAAIQTAAHAAKRSLKVLYVDSDHSFTQQRFQQVSGRDWHQLSELIMLFLPDTFEDQRSLVESLSNFVTPYLGLIVIDSVSSLYRAEFSTTDSIFNLNRDLTRQLAYLADLTIMKKVACLITSQVHARLKPPYDQIEPVARRALFHFLGTILRIRNTPSVNVKEFSLERLRGVESPGGRCLVALVESGLSDRST